MDHKGSRLNHSATSGMNDRQDAVIHLILTEEDTGIILEDIQSLLPERVAEIRVLIESIVQDLCLTDLAIRIQDRGAQDFVSRARFLAAVHRGMDLSVFDNEDINGGGGGGQGEQEGGDHENGGGGNGETEVENQERGEGQGETEVENKKVGGSQGTVANHKLRRSRIYIPGNKPRMILKACQFGADTIILDLEDSVPPEEKDSARYLVAASLENLGFGSSERMVRINPLDVGGIRDLEAVLPFGPDAIVLPKCESPDPIHQIEKLIQINTNRSSVEILPLIETAKGVINAYEIATSSPRVTALTFGGEDFTRDIGAERTSAGDELFLARSMIVLGAKAAGIQALDTVYANVKDLDGLRQNTRRIRAMGFDGKGAIHPNQIPVIHEVFTPTEEEIQKAVDIVYAAKEAVARGEGIAVIGGKMIDVPVIRRAERVIETARMSGLIVPDASSQGKS